jgi:hypothetical protein
LNPDNATAYKFRGRAQTLLGNFKDAAQDLRTACKIDYDEQVICRRHIAKIVLNLIFIVKIYRLAKFVSICLFPHYGSAII